MGILQRSYNNLRERTTSFPIPARLEVRMDTETLPLSTEERRGAESKLDTIADGMETF